MGQESIILGDGVFAVNDVDVALTRGGGSFAIEREYRQIEADGDYGPVKGRIRKIRSVATLALNALELLPANMTTFYPAMEMADATVKDVMTAALDVADGDYNKVSWTGKTKAGKEVYIELQDAINLENLEWNLIDKEEVVPVLTMTAAYSESDRQDEPWKVEFVKDDAFDITFLVVDSVTGSAISGAIIVVDAESLTTGHDGRVKAKNKANDTYAYTVNADEYVAGSGSVVVNGADKYEVVQLVAV